MERAQNKIRRVLMLIDALAPLRMPFTLEQATRLLAERIGSKVNVCERTIRRDFELLISMDFIYVHKRGKAGTRGAGSTPAQYRMNLRANPIAELIAKKISRKDDTDAYSASSILESDASTHRSASSDLLSPEAV